jgi:subtilisin family serine protease
MSDSGKNFEFTPLTRPDGGEPVAMDFRLQHVLALRQHGDIKPVSATTGAGEVSVIAKLSDLEGFRSLPGVNVGTVLGGTAEDGTTIATARIPISRLNRVRQDDSVLSLKAAQRLRPMLAKTTSEVGARPDDLPAGSSTEGGRGVIVGIVDSGCDFAHHNFLNDDGTTRLLKLWDQNGSDGGEGDFGYGTFYRPADINAALAERDPYEALGYGPDPAEPAHGTHVMDIAAGNGRGSRAPGVASDSDLIFVELAGNDIPWRGEDVVGTSLGDSVQLLEALAFIFEAAGDTPCSVNVSLGTNGGPHDGTTLVEQGIDRLLTQKPNRSVCIAASNSFGDGIHAAATVPRAGTHDLIWRVLKGDLTQNELELWYPGDNALSIELITPVGESIGILDLGRSATASRGGKVVLFAANRPHDPNNGDNAIGVFMSKDVPIGDWTLRLHNASSTDVPFHAWIERDDDGQSSFAEPLDNSHTVGSISCGHKTIVVGSYDAHVTKLPLSWFSSSGPTRDGRRKPEVSAPGHEVVAARSRSATGTVAMSGTSMAAPAVAGCVALLMAAARAQGKSLDVDQIRALVTGTARVEPPTTGTTDLRYGEGRVSASLMIEKMMTR